MVDARKYYLLTILQLSCRYPEWDSPIWLIRVLSEDCMLLEYNLKDSTLSAL